MISPSVMLASLWVIAAWALSLLPTKRAHWPLAYALMAAGVPLLIFIWVRDGPIPALLGLGVGMIVLRWPVRYLWRWIRRHALALIEGRP